MYVFSIKMVCMYVCMYERMYVCMYVYYCVRRFDAAVKKSLSRDSDPIISSDSSDDSSEDNSSSRHTYIIHPTSPAHRHTYMGSSTSLIHDDDLSTVNNNNYVSGSSQMASHIRYESKEDESAHTYIHSHPPSYRTPADADSKVCMYVCMFVPPSFPSITYIQ